MPIHLLFGIHCHQPVGNFDSVLEREVGRAYAPFLEVAEAFPDFHFSAHYSGWLLAWIGDHYPAVLDRLARLVARGQVEVMTGGFYEPILSAIPRPDRASQIERHQAFLESHVGVRARGLWLTERVWEPELVSDLARANIDYVTVDDYHFQAAGFDRAQLTGCFLTEDSGSRVAVFPIDMQLRYLTPFHPPEAAIDYLLAARKRWGWSSATIADDGEKYGTWPGTHALAYKERWLARFMEQVGACPEIRASTFSEYRATHDPQGLAYLPNTSYFEMSEWSLPAIQAAQMVRLVTEEERRGRLDAVKPFLSGGIWKGFLVKYPESNRMHKRGLTLSQRIEALGPQVDDGAVAELHAAQANDAYWHGVFGGLYLPHLRHTVWRHLNQCEALLPPLPARELRDEDSDGHAELHLNSTTLHATVDLAGGGVVSELSDRESATNFGATLPRRFEHYHLAPDAEASAPPPEAATAGSDGERSVVRTIHDNGGTAMAQARTEMVYDLFPPAIGRLVYLAPGEPVTPRVAPGGHPPAAPPATVAATYDGNLIHHPLAPSMEAAVAIELDDHRARLLLTYHLHAGGGLPPGRVAVEICLALPGCDSPATYYAWPGDPAPAGGLGEAVERDNAFGVDLVDTTIGRRLQIRLADPALVALAPMRTVSQSEAGADICYQQSWVMAAWPLVPVANTWHGALTVEITHV
ncbi:MAG: 4-alpha-glucanotransferase [Nitrospirae bacterium CG18_big_fil_WC_8_21_14_2_50_70_55]|nr:DUF1925 domain-containing protein [Deltaproteobacteria bacterium]OIP64168.1 MAG: hypothetical protein AUK30_07085 [Nitrospirae bacterium CG2_30_70_394]PIQ03423.1 MAG: 4-alpha-glucanotransferase [Nitrospirae bacterium CG18_big_fil_WC_8_21_14_2_50_70_55]PIU77275.1 MAG: 4-alpha-glucanotransferase [Nitrospirae bacterium CG06_land_8_20_14_3_00_70_43]PIW83720.1 MAG: 4-alpha-glucanotransferase [Nitrospirae bacterium CG_4_8_14_3_um_filter_70_85]PIX82462.1 MAG: 4-alpha-glucanotransferase [Nitrospira